jgi:hypothetical protein
MALRASAKIEKWLTGILSSLRYCAQKRRFCFGFLGMPGFGPAADSLFFASPKKSEQKKGEQATVALRAALRYSHRSGSGSNSLRSNTRPP